MRPQGLLELLSLFLLLQLLDRVRISLVLQLATSSKEYDTCDHTRPQMVTTYNAKRYAEIYLDRIVCLHGVPKTIISDRGAQLVARFWEQLQEYLGTKLIRSLAYHPQTNVQTKRVNQNSRRHVESLCHSL